MPGAPKVYVRNLGPFDREIPGTEHLSIPVGGEVGVTPEMAGSAPGPWSVVPVAEGGHHDPVAQVPDGEQYRWAPVEQPADMDALKGQHVAMHGGVLCRLESRHPGDGLLAQDDVWQLVTPTAKSSKGAPAGEKVEG